jgi:hypothetical protein
VDVGDRSDPPRRGTADPEPHELLEGDVEPLRYSVSRGPVNGGRPDRTHSYLGYTPWHWYTPRPYLVSSI